MGDILKEILKGRVEELKGDIKKYTALELDAKCERDEVYYKYRITEARQTLKNVTMMIQLNNLTNDFIKRVNQ